MSLAMSNPRRPPSLPSPARGEGFPLAVWLKRLPQSRREPSPLAGEGREGGPRAQSLENRTHRRGLSTLEVAR